MLQKNVLELLKSTGANYQEVLAIQKAVSQSIIPKMQTVSKFFLKENIVAICIISFGSHLVILFDFFMVICSYINTAVLLTIIFPHLTNQIIVFWRSCCH